MRAGTCVVDYFGSIHGGQSSCCHGQQWYEGAVYGSDEADACQECCEGRCTTIKERAMSNRDELARHLAQLSVDREHTALSWQYRMADHIRADPQAHVDALAEAGVLKPQDMVSGMTLYRVIDPEPPHVHDYRVVSVSLGHFTHDPAPFYRIETKCACGYVTFVNRPEAPKFVDAILTP